ncbi:MAG: oligosaccharide flippase family protein [Candidatus Omnitrophica bacterium]|nr:oligosaccharide flippase family protein [Candidatus Omnitrophota bacterium]
MSTKKEIIKDVSLYAFATYLTQALDIVISILMKRFLGPAASGIWAGLQVILMYARHVNLGTADAAYREIPYLRGKEEFQKAEEIKNAVFWFSFINALVLALGIACYAFWNRAHLSAPIFWGLLTVAGLIVLQRIYNYLVVLLRAVRNFTLASKVMIFSSAAGLLPLLFLTWKFKIYGYFAATLLIFIFNILFILSHQKFRFPWTLSWSRLKPLITFGFSMMLLGIADTVFRSMDRIVISKFLGFEQLGFYTLAIMAANYLVSFPNMLHVVLFPHFQEKYSKRDKAEDLRGYVFQSTLALAYLFPFILGACWIFSELLVAWVLPQFRAGILPLKILVVGIFFLCLNQQFSILLITLKKHIILIPVTICLTLIAVISSYTAIQHGYGLPGVAWVMAVNYFVYFMIYFNLGARQVFSKRESLGLLARIMGIVLYFVAVLLALELVIPAPANVLFRSLMRYALFAAALSPFVWILNRETGLIRHLKEMIRDRFSKVKEGNAEAIPIPPEAPGPAEV